MYVNYGRTHSTSNLEKHTQRHHKKDENIMSERANNWLKLCAEISTGTQMQKKLTSFIESSNMEYQECLLDWMVSSYQLLSAIQNDLFHKMVRSLKKNAPVIGEDKIQSLMPMKYFETMQSITKIVKGKDVSLTTNAWTSIAKEGYVTCTLHFIGPLTWTLHDFSLGIFKKDGTSTAVDVVRYAEDQMKKIKVSYPQLTCIVTDTKSMMIAAGCLFKEKSVEAGGTDGCIDHKLDLVTKLAFKDTPESNGTMAACHAIVTFFNSSSQATEKLKEKTKARVGTALTVIQDVVTRWWSTFSMCDLDSDQSLNHKKCCYHSASCGTKNEKKRGKQRTWCPCKKTEMV
jgi:hypothetical protein